MSPLPPVQEWTSGPVDQSNQLCYLQCPRKRRSNTRRPRHLITSAASVQWHRRFEHAQRTTLTHLSTRQPLTLTNKQSSLAPSSFCQLSLTASQTSSHLPTSRVPTPTSWPRAYSLRTRRRPSFEPSCSNSSVVSLPIPSASEDPKLTTPLTSIAGATR